MSLVNDLLLEAERRRGEGSSAHATALDDLVAVRARTKRPASKRARTPERGHTMQAIGVAAAGLVACGLALGAGLLLAANSIGIRLEKRLESHRSEATSLAARPPVAARPTQDRAIAAPPPADTHAPVPAALPPSEPIDLPIDPPLDPSRAEEAAPHEGTHSAESEPFVEDELVFESDFDTEDDARVSGARVIRPSLGDPFALSVEPSRRDRERATARAERAERDLLLRAARAARRAQRWDEAEAAYAKVLERDPENAVVLVEACEVLAALGRMEEALARVAAAREPAPKSRPLLLGQAQLLARAGDPIAAVELLDASGLTPTEAPDVHALAAAYLQRSGQHDRAIERYEQLLRRFPEESRAWLGLGISLEAVGRQNDARDVYRIALSVGELPMPTRSWVTSRLAASRQEPKR